MSVLMSSLFWVHACINREMSSLDQLEAMTTALPNGIFFSEGWVVKKITLQVQKRHYLSLVMLLHMVWIGEKKP